MKHLTTLLLFCLLGLSGCGHAPDMAAEQSELRFHMNFNNYTYNDLDLHVVEPGGQHLALKLKNDQTQSQLGNDCSCGSCSYGPEENIYWQQNQAGKGLYEIWVQQFQICGEQEVDSEFTIDVYEGNQLKATLQSKLQKGHSQTLYYEFDG